MGRKVPSQAAASYDLAMAQHMLASGKFEKLKMLETMKAGADARRAVPMRSLPSTTPRPNTTRTIAMLSIAADKFF